MIILAGGVAAGRHGAGVVAESSLPIYKHEAERANQEWGGLLISQSPLPVTHLQRGHLPNPSQVMSFPDNQMLYLQFLFL